MASKQNQGVVYQIFRCYLRFFHDHVFYKKVHRIGMSNIPQSDKPLLLVSNHQNCLNDPLGLIFTFRDRKPHILARADVIEYNWLSRKFLRSIGLLPTFRLSFDGEEALSRNADSFAESENALLDGGTIIMFPEGMHQDKRWLGSLSTGFTKMAFEAAEKSGFQKEILIQPSCNHYSNYYGIQNEMILKFGKPISVAPYYELYKTKPRTAQRQVIEAVGREISNLMLNITDLDNYEAIDFIRNIYGRQFAIANNLNPNHFPDMLQADKALVAKLDELKNTDSAKIENIYSNALCYKQLTNSKKITDIEILRDAKFNQIIANIFSLIIFLPAWLISLWPNIFIYCLPNIAINKLKDKMFEGTVRYSVSVLFTIPFFYTLTFALTLLFTNIWIAFFHLCILPVLGIFAWNYIQFAKRTLRMIRFSKLSDNEKDDLIGLRKTIIENLKNTIK